MKPMEILSSARRAMDKDLCDHCLGRLFAQLGHGLTNDERGKTIRIITAMLDSDGKRVPVKKEPEVCSLCENVFQELEPLKEYVIEEVEDYEFDTFLVGSKLDPSIEEMEEQLWAELEFAHPEPLKSEINRELGKLLDSELEAEVDLERPDVKCIVDTRFHVVDIEVSPMFIYGRYRKLSREIPQTKWDCRYCQGVGCDNCGGTGKMYETSVEEIIGEPLLEMTSGTDFTLHGMGREDIDALMLGKGRPFVMEIKEPVIRSVDLQNLQDEVAGDGRVEISDLKRVDKEMVQEVKNARSDKSYLVKVLFHEDIERAKLKKVLQSLRGTEISQKTPNRVSHRRADKIRKRKVIDLWAEEHHGDTASIGIRCEAGMYVKEFIHGDEGRTSPNLSESLGVGCEVQTLDVTEIHYE